SWERQYVTDIGHSGQVHDAPFKSESVACVTGGSVFSQIQIESVFIQIHAEFLHSVAEFPVVVLPLASSDDFTDSRHKAVHGGSGLSIVVLLHIECFDFLRIVGYKYRFLINFFGQVSLMLGLKITSP